jgi:leucyl-tRNA synthetase
MNEAIRLLAVILVPFAPHFANELAEAYGSTSPLEEQSWPAYDPKLVVDDVIAYGVQVMGKLRAEIQAPATANEAEVRAIAEADGKVQAALAGKTVKKFVFVPKKIVNFVVG